MNSDFYCLLLCAFLSTGAYAASSTYRLAQQDIDSIEDLKARFQSPLVKQLLEVLKTQSKDENVATFIQAILQTTEATDQSRSVNEREVKEMGAVIAAYENLPDKVRAQFPIILAFTITSGVITSVLNLIASFISAAQPAPTI